MQRFDGDLELLVADDFSDDSTVAITSTLTEKLKYKVTILPSSQNIGFVKNYQRGFTSCSGDYIAVIEGDDYWTDPLRLQKHIDFLQAHAECVMSMNRIIYYDETKVFFSVDEWDKNESFYYVNTPQMAMGNRLGNLSACVFRKSQISKIPHELFDLTIADWMIGMVLSQYGFIAILKDAMSVYRVHDKGIFSGMFKEERDKHLLELADTYNNYFNRQYNDEFQVFKNNILKTQITAPVVNFRKKDFVPPIFIAVLKLLIPPFLVRRFRN